MSAVEETDIGSTLVDLSGLSLAAVGSCQDEALASAMTPLWRQIDVPTNSVGGHNS